VGSQGSTGQPIAAGEAVPAKLPSADALGAGGSVAAGAVDSASATASLAPAPALAPVLAAPAVAPHAPAEIGTRPAVDPGAVTPPPPVRQAAERRLPRRRRAEVLAGTPNFTAPALDQDADSGAEAAVASDAGEGEETPRGRVAIRPGDTLGHLAVEHYGYYSRELIDEIRRANPAVDERMLQPGQEILLPRAGGGGTLDHLPGPAGDVP
jgi:hypothetical protein